MTSMLFFSFLTLLHSSSSLLFCSFCYTLAVSVFLYSVSFTVWFPLILLALMAGGVFILVSYVFMSSPLSPSSSPLKWTRLLKIPFLIYTFTMLSFPSHNIFYGASESIMSIYTSYPSFVVLLAFYFLVTLLVSLSFLNLHMGHIRET